MVKSTFADYVDLLFTLFERFWQHDCAHPHRGCSGSMSIRDSNSRTASSS